MYCIKCVFQGDTVVVEFKAGNPRNNLMVKINCNTIMCSRTFLLSQLQPPQAYHTLIIIIVLFIKLFAMTVNRLKVHSSLLKERIIIDGQ